MIFKINIASEPSQELITACCVLVIDVGTQTNTTDQKNQSRREVILGWELIKPAQRSTSEPIIVYKCYEMSIALDSNFRKDVEQILGDTLNADSYKRFTPKGLLGSYCQLTLSNLPTSDDHNFLSVSSLYGLPSNSDRHALPKPKTPYGLFMTSEPDMDLLSRLPSEIQAKIKQSIEFSWAIKNQKELDYEE